MLVNRIERVKFPNYQTKKIPDKEEAKALLPSCKNGPLTYPVDEHTIYRTRWMTKQEFAYYINYIDHLDSKKLLKACDPFSAGNWQNEEMGGCLFFTRETYNLIIYNGRK